MYNMTFAIFAPPLHLGHTHLDTPPGNTPPHTTQSHTLLIYVFNFGHFDVLHDICTIYL